MIRCRLAASKDEMCDNNIALRVCDCCARNKKRQRKVRWVLFPPRDAEQAPAWLPWAVARWQQDREAWFDQVDEILNIESYMRLFFKTQERLTVARMALDGFEGNAY
ncbi:hypothetical protein N9L68_00075 [bacterium]|nr:hypothetical protein [bacterium]